MECDTLEEVVVAEQPLTEADDRTSIMAEATLEEDFQNRVEVYILNDCFL